MLQNQKGTIIKLLKAQEAAKNYTDNYWFPYGDFLDPTDRFTDFSCENLAGKQPFITIIENLLHKDQTAEAFVQVYGLEEYAHDEPVIYADTLILFSRLPLFEIKQIFNEPGDTVPSDIGEITDFSQQVIVVDDIGNVSYASQQTFIIHKDGSLSPVTLPPAGNMSVYYCWWD